MIDESVARFAAALPSSGPAVPAVTSDLKSSVLTSTHVPVLRLVASIADLEIHLVGNAASAAAPNRHCSPS